MIAPEAELNLTDMMRAAISLYADALEAKIRTMPESEIRVALFEARARTLGTHSLDLFSEGCVAEKV